MTDSEQQTTAGQSPEWTPGHARTTGPGGVPRDLIVILIDEVPEIFGLDQIEAAGEPTTGKTSARVLVAAEFEAARNRPAVRHPSARSATTAGNPEGTRS